MVSQRGNTVEVNLFAHGLEVDFLSFDGPGKHILNLD